MEDLKRALKYQKDTVKFIRELAHKQRNIDKKDKKTQLEFLDWVEKYMDEHSEFINERKFKAEKDRIAEKRKELEGMP